MTTPDEEPGIREDRGDLDPAALFAIVWEAVAETLGTAGTAAIVRRAAARAATQSRELVDLVIRREKLEYCYTLPHAWSGPAEAATPGERAPIALRHRSQVRLDLRRGEGGFHADPIPRHARELGSA